MKKTTGEIIIKKLKKKPDWQCDLWRTKAYLMHMLNNLGSKNNYTGIIDKATFIKEFYNVLSAFDTGDFMLPNNYPSQTLRAIATPTLVTNTRLNLISSALPVKFPFRQTFTLKYTPNVVGNTRAHNVVIGLCTLPNINLFSVNNILPANLPWVNDNEQASGAFSSSPIVLTGTSWVYVQITAGANLTADVFVNANIATGSVANNQGSGVIEAASNASKILEVSIECKDGSQFSILAGLQGGPAALISNVGCVLPSLSTCFFMGDWLSNTTSAGIDQPIISIISLNPLIVS